MCRSRCASEFLCGEVFLTEREAQVTHGESVAVLRVMHEQEGDVLVRVWDDTGAATGTVVFQGPLKLEIGVLKVSDALGEAVLAIPTAAGWTDVVIYTDAATEPTRVDVVVAGPVSSGSGSGGPGDREVPLSGAVPLKALQDKARCVVDMSTEGARAGAPLETAAWNKGRDIGYIGESLQITCPRRSSRPSSATSRTPSRPLQICAELSRAPRSPFQAGTTLVRCY